MLTKHTAPMNAKLQLTSTSIFCTPPQTEALLRHRLKNFSRHYKIRHSLKLTAYSMRGLEKMKEFHLRLGMDNGRL